MHIHGSQSNWIPELKRPTANKTWSEQRSTLDLKEAFRKPRRRKCSLRSWQKTWACLFPFSRTWVQMTKWFKKNSTKQRSFVTTMRNRQPNYCVKTKDSYFQQSAYCSCQSCLYARKCACFHFWCSPANRTKAQHCDERYYLKREENVPSEKTTALQELRPQKLSELEIPRNGFSKNALMFHPDRRGTTKSLNTPCSLQFSDIFQNFTFLCSGNSQIRHKLFQLHTQNGRGIFFFFLFHISEEQRCHKFKPNHNET